MQVCLAIDLSDSVVLANLVSLRRKIMPDLRIQPVRGPVQEHLSNIVDRGVRTFTNVVQNTSLTVLVDGGI